MNRLHTYAASAALVGALALTACGSSDISHGTITGKQHVPEHTYTYMQPIYTTQCTGSGSSHFCYSTISMYVPITETDPECWRLDLRKDKKTGHVCVSQHSWETAILGKDW